ncbi:MAG: lysylphosphatidylglycerol synthase transmembrane domain-containing protein [Vicinamibacterales bacterium]|nr:lysylphosphatidylglycerol synthase transmembrane domain-containing protein [Vicinamibacterales bacterium]
MTERASERVAGLSELRDAAGAVGGARSWGLFALKGCASAGLLAWVLFRADLVEVWSAVRSATTGWLAFAVLLVILGPAIMTMRWHGLLGTQGVHLPRRALFGSLVVAGFFRQFLPSTIGGDAVRAYDSWRAGASKSVALTVLVVDRLTGLVALLGFIVVALGFSDRMAARLPGAWGVVAIAAGGLGIAIWTMFAPASALVRLAEQAVASLPGPVRKIGEKALWAATAYRNRRGALAPALGWSVVLQLNVVTFYFAIAQSLGLGIAYHEWFVIVPIAFFVMLLPISINGIGLRESVFIFLLGAFAVTREQAVAFAWIEFGLFLLHGVAGGVWYAIRRST